MALFTATSNCWPSSWRSWSHYGLAEIVSAAKAPSFLAPKYIYIYDRDCSQSRDRPAISRRRPLVAADSDQRSKKLHYLRRCTSPILGAYLVQLKSQAGRQSGLQADRRVSSSFGSRPAVPITLVALPTPALSTNCRRLLQVQIHLNLGVWSAPERSELFQLSTI